MRAVYFFKSIERRHLCKWSLEHPNFYNDRFVTILEQDAQWYCDIFIKVVLKRLIEHTTKDFHKIFR